MSVGYLDGDGDGKILVAELVTGVRSVGGELVMKGAEMAGYLDSDGGGLEDLEDVGLTEAVGKEKMKDLKEPFGM